MENNFNPGVNVVFSFLHPIIFQCRVMLSFTILNTLHRVLRGIFPPYAPSYNSTHVVTDTAVAFSFDKVDKKQLTHS